MVSHFKPHSQQRGFTFIEVLVALTITLLVSGGIIGISFQLFRTYSRINAQNALQAESTIIINQLRDDIRWATDGVTSSNSGGFTTELVIPRIETDPNTGNVVTESILYQIESGIILRASVPINTTQVAISNFQIIETSDKNIYQINFTATSIATGLEKSYEVHISSINL